jgi:hypothetical protein
MAKSTTDYYNDLITAKEATVALDVLTSTSEVAIWRSLLWVQAFCLSRFEELIEWYEGTIQDKSNQVYFATGAWWQQKMFEFQFGDQLSRSSIDGTQYIQYAVITPANRIITRCSVKTKPRGGLLIKLATLDGKLSEEQLNAVASYVKNFQPEGIFIELFTREADLLQLSMDLIYDPILTKAIVKANVEKAIFQYIESIDFTGEFDLRQMENYIQAVAGVKSFVTKNAKGRPEGGNFLIFNRAYNGVSGYYEIDPSFDLTASINYIPSTSL